MAIVVRVYIFIRHCTTRSLKFPVDDKCPRTEYFLQLDHRGSTNNKGKSTCLEISIPGCTGPVFKGSVKDPRPEDSGEFGPRD
ncbi:hypothetical protein K0M31_009330 [Melipona bicolor]|uniref:Uncharacterized protein n=1 Tax=Melipona bicolor TaxID=60889 RepID=A0AA40FQ09_9HYME|nr:hypothetical protein K0M31_009330 [Melipona bicolor]